MYQNGHRLFVGQLFQSGLEIGHAGYLVVVDHENDVAGADTGCCRGPRKDFVDEDPPLFDAELRTLLRRRVGNGEAETSLLAAGSFDRAAARQGFVRKFADGNVQPCDFAIAQYIKLGGSVNRRRAHNGRELGRFLDRFTVEAENDVTTSTPACAAGLSSRTFATSAPLG